MSDSETEEYEPSWYPYEGGETVGQIGPAGGYVLRDEEFGDPEDEDDADARVTLEQGRAENPGFFVTATLYGWMHVTHRAADEAASIAAYEEVRAELTRLSGMIPYEEDRNVAGKARALTEAITAFEERFA